MTDAYKRNWITSRDGNASIRHQDRDHFYVTPTGVRKQTLQPDQFKKMGIRTSNYGRYATELNYTDGVTSAIQTQLDAKASRSFAIAQAVALG